MPPCPIRPPPPSPPSRDPALVAHAAALVDALEANVTLISDVIAAASAARGAAAAPAAAAAWLATADASLACAPIADAQRELERAVCTEVATNWALLALLLPFAALTLLVDAALHVRFLVGTPSLRLPAGLGRLVRRLRCLCPKKPDRTAAIAAAEEAAAEVAAEAEQARQQQELEERLERQWRRDQKRRAQPAIATNEFAASFVQARVLQAQANEHFAAADRARRPGERSARPVKAAWSTGAAAAPPEAVGCFDL